MEAPADDMVQRGEAPGVMATSSSHGRISASATATTIPSNTQQLPREDNGTRDNNAEDRVVGGADAAATAVSSSCIPRASLRSRRIGSCTSISSLISNSSGGDEDDNNNNDDGDDDDDESNKKSSRRRSRRRSRIRSSPRSAALVRGLESSALNSSTSMHSRTTGGGDNTIATTLTSAMEAGYNTVIDDQQQQQQLQQQEQSPFSGNSFCSTTTSSSSEQQQPLELLINKSSSNNNRLLVLVSSFVARRFGNSSLLFIIAAWFLLGVVAIVTTKVLLEGWNVSPIILTCQQLFLSSSLLYLKLAFASSSNKGGGGGGVEPIVFPNLLKRFWNTNTNLTSSKQETNNNKDDSSSSPLSSKPTPALEYIVLAGIFNAMDFLASNTAFGASAASFVETIKASDPISTSAVALTFKVDRIGSRYELISLFLLVIGMLFSTYGNSQEEDDGAAAVDNHSRSSIEDSTTDKWAGSARAATLVVTANFCFAFRAMFQKLYRRRCDEISARENNCSPSGDTESAQQSSMDVVAVVPVNHLNDENLFCRLQQVGWITLLVPSLLYYHDAVWGTIWDYQSPSSLIDETFWQYVQVSFLNAAAFLCYNLASSYVLTNLTVLHHSTLNCLRRLFAIISTSLFFGVPMTLTGAFGVLTSFIGFCGFTYHRSLRQRKTDKHEK